ncbi:MAG TPA: transcription initiation factor IIB [Nitrososphaera sp.]|nr:transcription initiation factor IIB [Nitrososphaera sp.]
MLVRHEIDNNLVMCSVCSGHLISDPDSGEEICGSCGIVVRDNLELAAERRAFTLEEMDKRYRSGEPASIMMHDMGLSSFMDNKNVDANGKHIQGYSEIERLRRLNKITVSNNSKTKNLNKAMREIRRITEILGISMPVAERAAYIYRKALDKGLIKGRSITGIVAATIYIACKDTGTPRSIHEIQEVIGNADRKNIAYYYKFLLREMKIHVPLPVPSNSISRIADKACLSEKTVRKALEILSLVGDSAMLSGKNPVSLAAAALYLSTIETSEYTTQLRIAIAADVSTVTVRKRCLEIIHLVKAGRSQILSKSLEKSQELLPIEEKEQGIEMPSLPQQQITAPGVHSESRNVKGLFLASRQSQPCGLPDLPVHGI